MIYHVTNNDPAQVAAYDSSNEPPVTSGTVRMDESEYSTWLMGQPAKPLRQDTLIVLNRLTDAESQALHSAEQSDYRVWKFIHMADCGVIDQADPNYAAGVALLDSLGIIAAARWPTLLAP